MVSIVFTHASIVLNMVCIVLTPIYIVLNLVSIVLTHVCYRFQVQRAGSLEPRADRQSDEAGGRRGQRNQDRRVVDYSRRRFM